MIGQTPGFSGCCRTFWHCRLEARLENNTFWFHMSRTLRDLNWNLMGFKWILNISWLQQMLVRRRGRRTPPLPCWSGPIHLEARTVSVSWSRCSWAAPLPARRPAAGALTQDANQCLFTGAGLNIPPSSTPSAPPAWSEAVGAGMACPPPPAGMQWQS